MGKFERNNEKKGVICKINIKLKEVEEWAHCENIQLGTNLREIWIKKYNLLRKLKKKSKDQIKNQENYRTNLKYLTKWSCFMPNKNNVISSIIIIIIIKA